MVQTTALWTYLAYFPEGKPVANSMEFSLLRGETMCQPLSYNVGSFFKTLTGELVANHSSSSFPVLWQPIRARCCCIVLHLFPSWSVERRGGTGQQCTLRFERQDERGGRGQKECHNRGQHTDEMEPGRNLFRIGRPGQNSPTKPNTLIWCTSSRSLA